MIKKVTILFCLLLVFNSCKEKDDLTVEEIEVVNEDEESGITDDVDSKPLIVVDKDDVVSILVRSDGYPGMWKGEDGEVYGFYVDLERMVMERMGQKYEFLPYDNIGVAAQGLKTGTSHVALAVPDVPDFRAFLNLTIPYETINYITFIGSDNNSISGSNKDDILESLKGKRVGVQTQGHVFQVLREFRDIILVEYPTTTEAMAALDRGEVDAVPENRETALYYSEINNWNVKDVGGFIHSFKNTSGYSTVYHPSIIDRHNTALQSLIDDGSVLELHRRYYGEVADEYAP